MVSLFGIKFGSDRKKARQAPKLAAEARDGKWARIDECTLGSGQYFGHNFSRPQPHRPSTSHSSAAPWSMKSEQQQSSWRVLRHHASAAELRAGEAAPHPLRQHGPRAEWAARQRSPLANGGSHAMSLDLPPPRQTSPASSLDVPPHRQQSLPSLDLPPPRQKSPSTSLDLPRLRQASPSSLHGPARQTTRPSLLPPQPNLASFDFPSPPRIDDASFPPTHLQPSHPPPSPHRPLGLHQQTRNFCL
ncbi:hypothetical protein CDD82_171 [Ophiocordyceps australis]|uniref:Uncharacterized protein n=1 Tax=Ophiocordyceps australis TaxID=1399860 RepID=A0A2C5YMJ7_9HYPO|nr:hypothetical protein CDD82_171 [Ophiocordyceps australis]